MLGKIIEFVGLPASGKSTLALHIAKESPNTTIVVNRDSLRLSIFPQGYKYTKQNERIITNAEYAAVTAGLEANMVVCIDATNLARRNHWRTVGVSYGASHELKDLRHVPLTDCIERDRWRPARVGAGVINGMALRAGLVPWSGKPIAIVDIDGTLADLRHRLHYIESKPKDYESFYAYVINDDYYEPILDLVRGLHHNGHEIVIVSGRPQYTGSATYNWLRVAELPPFLGPFMRSNGDYRPDHVIKSEILALLPRNIVVAVDDRDSVIEGAWRPAGIPVIKVNEGQVIYDERNI